MPRSSGFSFIELMVALVITAILCALALPAYGNFMTRARRAEGRMALLHMMQQQERYFSQYNSYSAFDADAPAPLQTQFRWWSGASPSSSYYELSARACEGEDIRNCVRVSAQPGTARVRAGYRDDACGALSLSSSGVREPESPQECWQ